VNPRLLQLASPSLPVGAYSYSQGLEAACEAGIVRDEATARAWIGDVFELTVARLEAPVLLRLIEAWREDDAAAAARWNDEFVASRESAELRAETLQMGYSMRRLLVDLGLPDERLDHVEPLSYPAAYAFAAAAWALEPREALDAYLFAWLENQVLAAVKCVPLGQAAGQRILLALSGRIPAIGASAAALHDDELGNFAPGLAILSSRHETQYSRLFRS
jgi:urease accessory protein